MIEAIHAARFGKSVAKPKKVEVAARAERIKGAEGASEEQTAQQRWRAKNKAKLAAYMRGWRAKRKGV